MLNKKIRKQILYDKLNKLLKLQGFVFDNRFGAPQYIYKENNKKVVSIYMNFNDIGSTYVSGLLLSINEVEDIVLEIGNKRFPNIILETYHNKENFLITVNDTHFIKLFKDKYYLVSPETETEMETMADWLVNYLTTRGFAFAEHYSYLPNILAKMDALEAEGKFWNGILAGTVDNVFCGLLISKLCNDSNLDEKIKMCDEKLNARESLVEWLPYYEKLKERLQTLQPKYDASTGRVFEGDEVL